MAFIGSYDHARNLDAATWLTTEIMPLVWARAPDIRCVLAGSAMPPWLRTPADPRIVSLGDVERLDDVLGQVPLTVAPLAFGAGLKGKVADSLAAGVPCVCTPIAAEGFDLPPPLDGFVAADAAGLAATIVRLHGSEAQFTAGRAAGLAYIERAFNGAVVDSGLRQAALPMTVPVPAQDKPVKRRKA